MPHFLHIESVAARREDNCVPESYCNIDINYSLSLELSDTGIYDAMYLAGLIAEPELVTKKDLTGWVKTAAKPIASYVVGQSPANAASISRPPLALKRLEHEPPVVRQSSVTQAGCKPAPDLCTCTQVMMFFIGD